MITVLFGYNYNGSSIGIGGRENGMMLKRVVLIVNGAKQWCGGVLELSIRLLCDIFKRSFDAVQIYINFEYRNTFIRFFFDSRN